MSMTEYNISIFKMLLSPFCGVDKHEMHIGEVMNSDKKTKLGQCLFIYILFIALVSYQSVH